MGLRKALIASIVALVCAGAVKAQSVHHAPLAAKISDILADPKVAGTHWGISVTQLGGTPIYALNDAQLFHPESNVKLFTTATALGILGPNRIDKTRLIVDGTRTNDVVNGRIILFSDGDAFLSDRTVPYDVKAADANTPPTLSQLDALVAKIAKTGISKIVGDVDVSSEYPWQPYGEGWNVDDLSWGYGAPVTGFVINDNEVQLRVTPGSQIGDAPTLSIAPDLAYYTFKNAMSTSQENSATNINVERNGSTLYISGQIALDAKLGDQLQMIAIDDPLRYAGLALKALFAQHGVTVTGDVHAIQPPPRNLLSTRAIIHEPLDLEKRTGRPGGYFDAYSWGPMEAEHVSPPLIDDVIATNKNSQNLHAELLLRKLADSSVGPGNSGATAWRITFAEGARVVHQFAINAGVKPDDFYFVDGSGLSTYDLATPRAFTQLLRYAATQPWGAEWKSSLPIGGVDGTLETRFTKAPLKGNVFAKTGTSSEDRALSGYVVCASGKTVVFSILVGDHLPGSNADRDVMDKIVAAIAAAN
jgi:serine-type D-Ala-D-Ala carboxypeptidase/endopeptidase (penicillin-binding protein 4)